MLMVKSSFQVGFFFLPSLNDYLYQIVFKLLIVQEQTCKILLLLLDCNYVNV
jgi:hypothetical protein